MLLRYTIAPVNHNTFYQDTNIDITTGYHGIMVLWFSRNKKFNIQKKLFFWLFTLVQALSELFIKQGDMGKGKKFHFSFVLLFVFLVSRWWQKKHVQFLLVVRWQSCLPSDKTCGSSVLCSSSPPVSCIYIVMMHCIGCIMALVNWDMYFILRNCIVSALLAIVQGDSQRWYWRQDLQQITSTFTAQLLKKSLIGKGWFHNLFI